MMIPNVFFSRKVKYFLVGHCPFVCPFIVKGIKRIKLSSAKHPRPNNLVTIFSFFICEMIYHFNCRKCFSPSQDSNEWNISKCFDRRTSRRTHQNYLLTYKTLITRFLFDVHPFPIITWLDMICFYYHEHRFASRPTVWPSLPVWLV